MAHYVVRRGELAWKTVRGRPTFPFEENTDVYLAWKDHGWVHPRQLVREMQAVLRERGIEMAVVVFPMRDQVNPQYRRSDAQPQKRR